MTMPFLALAFLGCTAGQPPAGAPDTAAEAAAAGATAKKRVGEYVLRLGPDGGKPLRLEPGPTLRWTNHLNRRFYGDVYIWTLDGRPEAAASINTVFAGDSSSTETELASLSEGRPTLTVGGTVVWSPAEAGVEMRPLTGAPPPGPTAAARLTQLRTLAAEFSVTADYGASKEEKEPLRLLRSPAHRYDSPGRGVVDGALFAFTKGTDPDALLMIEARRAGDAVEWRYAFARLNGYCSLRASRKGAEAWSAPRLPHRTNIDPTQPYCLIRK